jgi:hypothetical protein
MITVTACRRAATSDQPVSSHCLNVYSRHKLDPLLGGTFHGRQPRQFGTFLTQSDPLTLAQLCVVRLSHSAVLLQYPPIRIPLPIECGGRTLGPCGMTQTRSACVLSSETIPVEYARSRSPFGLLR